jgi:hypothetical protein
VQFLERRQSVIRITGIAFGWIRLGGQEAIDEIAVSERQRNASKARIKWMFTTGKTCAKQPDAIPRPKPKKL